MAVHRRGTVAVATEVGGETGETEDVSLRWRRFEVGDFDAAWTGGFGPVNTCSMERVFWVPPAGNASKENQAMIVCSKQAHRVSRLGGLMFFFLPAI